MVDLKTLYELGFQTVSEEEHLQQIQSERRKFRPLQHVSSPPKRKPGRPKKKVQLDTVLQVSMKMEDVVISKEETSRTKKNPRYDKKDIGRFFHPGASAMWAVHTDLEEDFAKEMKVLRKANVGFNSRLIQFQMKSFILTRCPETLKENGGRFEVSRTCVKKWIKTRLGWSYRKSTTPGKKLPDDWEYQGKTMIHRVAFLVNKYKVIFEGKTLLSTPRGANARILATNGFDITASESHWTTQSTLRAFVQQILVPWIHATCQNLGLDVVTQKTIWLIDAYSVHKSAYFKAFMEENYPNICLLFIPANCTEKLQPADVLLMRPFKCGIQREFGKWAVESIRMQMADGTSIKSARLQTSVNLLWNVACNWIFKAYNQLRNKELMVMKGWEKIGFLAAWDHDVQVKAAELNAVGGLFCTDSDKEVEGDSLPRMDPGWLGDSTMGEQMDNELSEEEDEGLISSNEEIIEDSLTCPRIHTLVVDSETPSSLVVPALDMPIDDPSRKIPRKRKLNAVTSKPHAVLDSQLPTPFIVPPQFDSTCSEFPQPSPFGHQLFPSTEALRAIVDKRKETGSPTSGAE
ncbi:hypothetical protein R1flu_013292 [Riccia fluitans]|uniref:DDE-1 domain-containing protein n=1 Tax=Riccia fluitans TaxID=41844 RepID=A0ABD1YCY7_9MARC